MRLGFLRAPVHRCVPLLLLAACSDGSGSAAPSDDAGAAGAPGDAAPDVQTPPEDRRWESRPVADPPSYLGSIDNGPDCSATPYSTAGFEPVDSTQGQHPLFLYFIGTRFVDTDGSARFDAPAPLAVTEAMARRGFVALSADYDNGPVAWLSDHVNQLDCMFGASHTVNLLAAACSLPNVDCDLGIATWGHSQGAFVAEMVYNFEPRVRAAWLTGYGGDARATLPHDRLRVVNAEADFDNGMPDKLNTIAGFAPTDCPADADQCLRDDGSGWIIVRQVDLADPSLSTAGHCWFDKRDCLDTMVVLEPNWVDPGSDKPFALETNADWVTETVWR